MFVHIDWLCNELLWFLWRSPWNPWTCNDFVEPLDLQCFAMNCCGFLEDSRWNHLSCNENVVEPFWNCNEDYGVLMRSVWISMGALTFRRIHLTLKVSGWILSCLVVWASLIPSAQVAQGGRCFAAASPLCIRCVLVSSALIPGLPQCELRGCRNVLAPWRASARHTVGPPSCLGDMLVGATHSSFEDFW